MEKVNYNSLLHIYAVALLGVTLDLASTRWALSLGFYETRPLGNQPLIYGAWMFMVLGVIFLGRFMVRGKQLYRLSNLLMFMVSLLPYYAAAWNVGVVSGWI